MWIAIEGLDGVGKSTLAKKLSKFLKFQYIEKPLIKLLKDKKTYMDLKLSINHLKNRELQTWFYAFSLAYCSTKYQDKNIVLDRYLLSNYAWIVSGSNLPIYQTLLQYIRIPHMTYILTASKKIVEERMQMRRKIDSDHYKLNYFDKTQAQLIALARKFNLPHEIIDTSTFNKNELFQHVSKKISGLIKK
jgi:dTMP kinase